MTEEEKNKQTAKGPSRNIFSPCFHINSCSYYKPFTLPFGGGILGSTDNPSVEHKEIPEKKLTKKEKNELYKKLIYKGLSPVDELIKPIDIKKPINEFNYLNALIRIPEVQKDLESISAKHVNKRERERLEVEFYRKYGEPIKLLQHPEVFSKYKKYYHNLNTIHVFSNFNKNDPKCLSAYKDGKHIIIAVDMSKKKQDIMKEFEKALDRINKDYNIPKDKTRDRGTVEDIWIIYDYHKKDKQNFSQIAKKLSHSNKNPTEDEIVRSYYMKVKRAYSKAKEIIEIVRVELKQKRIIN